MFYAVLKCITFKVGFFVHKTTLKYIYIGIKVYSMLKLSLELTPSIFDNEMSWNILRKFSLMKKQILAF